MPKADKILAKVRTSDLADLFGVSKRTIARWRSLGKLDTSSIVDIIDKYNNKAQLDGRTLRKRSQTEQKKGQSS